MLKRPRQWISSVEMDETWDKHSERHPLKWKPIFRGWRQRSRWQITPHQLWSGWKVFCCTAKVRNIGWPQFNADMHMPETQCQELVDRTAASIDSDILQLLFVSVQQVNLKTSIEYAIHGIFSRSRCPTQVTKYNVAMANDITFVADLHRGLKKTSWADLLWLIMQWFPHNWVSHAIILTLAARVKHCYWSQWLSTIRGWVFTSIPLLLIPSWQWITLDIVSVWVLASCPGHVVSCSQWIFPLWSLLACDYLPTTYWWLLCLAHCSFCPESCQDVSIWWVCTSHSMLLSHNGCVFLNPTSMWVNSCLQSPWTAHSCLSFPGSHQDVSICSLYLALVVCCSQCYFFPGSH